MPSMGERLDMVNTGPETTRLLNSHHIGWRLNDANDGSVSGFVRTRRAYGLHAEVSTLMAVAYSVMTRFRTPARF